MENKKKVYLYLGCVLDLVSILPVESIVIHNAYDLKAKDFEDALVAMCAKRQGVDLIITRNIKDFKNFDINVFNPETFIIQKSNH